MLLRQIQHFQAIIENNSFTEAAVQCHISQSAISQSIKTLEDELGVKLMNRKNRGFELTEAGRYFYKKSLGITAQLDKLCEETKNIANQRHTVLSVGCLSTYAGEEFNNAVARFAEKYPAVELNVVGGTHEELYDGLQTDQIDLALSDQRRAFADTYENVILKEAVCYIEIATFNPLSKKDAVNIEDLKNTSCILVAPEKQQEEEMRYYHDIIGFQGEFRYASTLQQAHTMVVANKGVMPLEGGDHENWFGASMKRVPLLRDGQPVKRKYCAFWKKNNSGYYVEEFADILEGMF